VKKYIIRCPKCSGERKKSSAPCCTALQFDTGVSYLCHHCGWKEFIHNDIITEHSEDVSQVVIKEAIEIPPGKLPFEDKECIWYKYYVDKKHIGLIYRKGNGEDKVIRPFIYTEDGWIMSGWRGKSLYRSELMKEGRTVLVVEGEKTAESAAKLFTNFDVVTWKGGAKNVASGDWDLLTNRRVILWPDNDAAGIEAMNSVANLINSKDVFICDVSKLQESEDLADLIEVNLEANKELIKKILLNKKPVIKDRFKGEFDPTQLQELHKEKIEYIPFGFPSMDKRVQMPQTGVVVVSGRTNHGKTAWMINTALNIAKNTDKTVLYLTLEFPVQELNLRMVKTLDGTTHSDSGWLDDVYFNNCLKDLSTPAAKQYYDLLLTRKLRVADSDVAMSEIIDIMNRCGKNLVVFIDYLQIIPLDGSTKARYEKLKDMIELLRSTANKNGQLIVGGSQLTAGDSPYTDQVRESKDLENTSALHLKIWNKEKARDDKERKVFQDVPGTIIVHVEKSRQRGANGRTFGFNSPNGCILVPAERNIDEVL